MFVNPLYHFFFILFYNHQTYGPTSWKHQTDTGLAHTYLVMYGRRFSAGLEPTADQLQLNAKLSCGIH